MVLSQLGTGTQVLGDHSQRIEPNTQRVYSRERADLLSDSSRHRTGEQANLELSLTSGAGGTLYV